MTRRCSLCAINYPVARHEKCLVCEEATTFFTDLNPHDDWEERVKQATNFAASSSVEAQVAENRLGRFRYAGLDLGRAMVFASDRTVDLHLFERLCKDGCEVETAVRIVAPL